MYIGVDGSYIKKRIDQIKDSLIFNFSIDRLDIPFSESKFGIRKNIPNSNTTVVTEELKAEISQLINNKEYFNGVTFNSLDLSTGKANVILGVNNETLSIPLE